MKTAYRFAAVTMAAALLTTSAAALQSAEPSVDYDAVAKRVVVESAGVKPGEVVVINGSPSELPLLEALEAAVLVAGGHPIVTLTSPRAQKRALMEAPETYLRQPPKSQVALLELGDVFISANGVADPALFADADEKRLNLVREANQAVTKAFASKRGRTVDIGQAGGIPTAAYAASRGADYNQMKEMFYRALAVPASEVAKRGTLVSGKMKPGQQVRLQTEAGTDITFRLANSGSRVSTGRALDNDTGKGMASAFLPAGDFYACVDPASANGTVVSAQEQFRGKKVKNVRMTFKNGVLTGLSAAEGAAALQGFFDQLDDGSKKLSVINVGLNPESKPLPGSDYLSWEMAGVPTIFLGESSWAGCAQQGEGSYAVHQPGATLTAGKEPVVKAGSLIIE